MPKSYASPPDDTSIIQKMGPTFEHSSIDFKGTPLFEFLSLKVGGHNFKDVDAASGYTFPHLEIYGRIELIDEDQNKFSLFRRKKNEAKTVFLHNPSNSSDPTNPTTVILNNFDIEGPRCIRPKFCLKFCLKDRRQDVTIFDDYKDVDCTRFVSYDEVQTCWFDTTPGLWVSFDFVLLRCALVANVGIIVDKKEKSPENNIAPAEVRGSITSATKLSDLSSIQRLLLDGSEELVFGILNNLASFAVPSYSFLEFEVNLEVNGDKIKHLSKFEPSDWFQIPYEDEFHGEAYHIRLIVDWGLGERFLPEYLSSELQYDTNKNGKLIYKQHPLDRYVSDNRRAYMEIFSVSVCFYGVDGCKGLNGKIEACDEDEDFVLFDGALGYHNSHETVNLTGPRRCYRGDYFLIDVNLKDGEGRAISSGCVGYDFSNAHIFYNMRMCSIIRGKHGFAALHYTILADAIQSKLKFALEPVTLCDNVNYEVYGKINASYSSYKYSTHYQRKYYQSTLFKKGKEEAVKLGVIPLSQSVVAVPLNGNTSLIVSAKLHVFLDGNHIETLQYLQTFNPPSPKRTRPERTRDEFTSKNFRFQASVKWTRFNL